MRTDTDPTPPHGIPRPPRLVPALVRFGLDNDAMESVTFGVLPDNYHGDTADLPGDSSVFYWLDRADALDLAPGFGVSVEGWVVIAVETPESCRNGHRFCAPVPGGSCANEHPDLLDEIDSNPFGGALDR